ncbi:DNA (cytosine-5-)-methyltransferase [Terrisporobacter vanillatitrophus]|uniref:DNA (cytosine-5-)-methyltransferase n=1 Tax=Terrisporobacter vanillatitrophus TaxID=3058402 RepID=UPI003367397F
MSSKTYKVASLFAGIGGICLGFKNNGCKIVWANEKDKYACDTYRHNFNGGQYLVEGDICGITKTKIGENLHDNLRRINSIIPDFDILTAGFPCQSFSISGKRKGFEDERGNLFFDILKIIKSKKPKAFLLENVKNLKTHDNGFTFKVIKEQLEYLGYHIKSEILNSTTHGNIPQNRERIFIVGFNKKELCDKFNFPDPIQLTNTISDLIDFNDKKDEKYYYNKTKYYNNLKLEITKQNTLYQIRRGQYIRENKNNVCPTLTANMGTGGHNVPLILDNYDIRKLTPEECLLFQGFNTKNSSFKYTFPKYRMDKNGKLIPYADSHKYKQIGNCVTVTVIERIAHNIIDILNFYDSNCINNKKL